MKAILTLALLAAVFGATQLNAQITPANANSDAECGADCWDLFSWSTVPDGSGGTTPNISEGLALDANCAREISASATYTGADSNGPDLVGTAIGANLQGTSVDSWEIQFGESLTNPVFSFSALETTTDVLITDAAGNEITANCISSCGSNLGYTAGAGWSGDVAYTLQLSGTFSEINLALNITSDDAYNFSVGTCLSNTPACAITNVQVVDVRCGDGFNADDAYADLTFDVVGGSGEYLTRVTDGVTNSTGGFSVGATDGTVTTGPQLTVGGFTAGTLVTLEVVDNNDQNGCQASNTVQVTIPSCPPCPEPGDLIITEILQDPDAVGDNEGEWFEVYNAAAVQFNLKNLLIQDNGIDAHTIAVDLLINPGEYLVLGRNSNDGVNGGVTVDYEYGTDLALANGEDELVLICQGTEIERVEWDGGTNWPDPTGASMQLGNLTNDNNDGANWCPSTSAFGDGDLGTPGAANGSCCELVVDCSNIVDTEIACRADLPSVDFDLPIIVESCGDPILSALTIIPGNSACPEDTVFITRTYFIQDQEGNMDQCMQTFTTISNNGPTITCPDDDFIDCDAGAPVVSADNATAVFECSSWGANPSNSVTVSAPVVDGTPGEVGTTYTYTYTATDGCGRMASCEQVFTVQDTISPVTTCKDSTIYLDEMGEVLFDPSSLQTGATDNCGIALISPAVLIPYDCSDADSVYTFTQTATDFSGNVGMCTSSVTILDTIAPVFDSIPLPMADTVQCEAELPPFGANLLPASDNCEVASRSASSSQVINTDGEVALMHGLAYVPTTGTMVDILDLTMGPLTIPSGSPVSNMILTSFSSPTGFRRWRARNPNSFPVEIRVQPAGGSGPVFYFEVPANTDAFFLTDAVGGSNTTIIQWLDETGTQKQTVKASSNAIDDDIVLTSDFCGMRCNSWTATDPSGNSVMYMQNFAILCRDTTPPTLTCIGDTTIFVDENGEADLDVFELLIGFSDNCTDSTNISFLDSLYQFDCTVLGDSVVSVIGFDEDGNSDTCTVTVTVLDTIAPIVSCPTDEIIECDEDPSPANTGEATATDNCSAEITFEDESTQTDDGCGQFNYTITRSWIATDPS
ncbi:MAG: lamin tail domain-containing protein, partial [Bacteroidota bacterium]